jgi:hypothetical protein
MEQQMELKIFINLIEKVLWSCSCCVQDNTDGGSAEAASSPLYPVSRQGMLYRVTENHIEAWTK